MAIEIRNGEAYQSTDPIPLERLQQMRTDFLADIAKIQAQIDEIDAAVEAITA